MKDGGGRNLAACDAGYWIKTPIGGGYPFFAVSFFFLFFSLYCFFVWFMMVGVYSIMECVAGFRLLQEQRGQVDASLSVSARVPD